MTRNKKLLSIFIVMLLIASILNVAPIFAASLPTITSPTEGQTLAWGNINITWTPATNATNYSLFIYDNTASGMICYYSNITSTNYVITQAQLTRGHSYTITLGSYNGSTLLGRVTRNFSIAASVLPTITNPTEGQSLAWGDLNITWTPAINATKYSLFIYDNTASGMICYYSNITSTNYVITQAQLTRGHSYTITLGSYNGSTSLGNVNRNFRIN